MSTYRTLSDMVIGGGVIPAGSTITMPTGSWTPPGCVDPIDSAAITDFWNAGVQPAPLARTQFSTQPVTAPQIFWRCINPTTNTFQLTGTGASLGTKNAVGMSLP
jgi:hypothetical protein